MAMLHLGMGDTTGVGTPATAVSGGEITPMSEFVAGMKTWLRPSDIGGTFSALWTAGKADPVKTLTSPGTLGFLLVPVAILAVVIMGMGAARRRRTRNPRRRVAYSRRRVRNPRRRANPRRKSGAGHDYEVVVGNVGTVYRGKQGFQAHLDYNKYVGISKHGGGRTEGEPVTLFMDGEIVKEYQGTVRNPKRRRNAGPHSIRRSKRWMRAATPGKGKGSWVAGVVRRMKGRATGRIKNSRSYILRGSMPAPSYTPGPGKIFTLAGRKGVVKSVMMDGNSKWVQFRRSVDGTSGMSLANFRQAARVENPGQRDAPAGYLLEVTGKRPTFYKGRSGTALDKAIRAGMKKMVGKRGTFSVTDSVSARTSYYNRDGSRG